MTKRACTAGILTACCIFLSSAPVLFAQQKAAATPKRSLRTSSNRPPDDRGRFRVSFKTGQKYDFSSRADAERFATQMKDTAGWDATVDVIRAGAGKSTKPKQKPAVTTAKATREPVRIPHRAAPSVVGTWRGDYQNGGSLDAIRVFHADGNGSSGTDRDFSGGKAEPFRWEQNGSEIRYYFSDGFGGVMVIDGGTLREDGLGSFRRAVN